ncbi:MAG: glycosyltransferase [Candidatus Omnitrophota bacterium]
MNKQILFSVIIPAFNRKNFLKKAVTSVLNQSYVNLELIVVDDGSSDGTDLFINSIKDNRLLFLKQSNHGVSHARNTAIRMAKGDFFAFLDSDDYWIEKKLEETVKYIENFPEISIFHTEEVWYRNGKLLNQKKKHKKPTGFVYNNSLPLCCISISTAVVKKQVFENVGIFDEQLQACEDYDFWLRATNKYEVKLIPEYCTIKDGGRPDQLSSSIWGLDRFRIQSLEKMLLSGNLNSENYNATLKEFQKKCRIFALGAKKRGKAAESDSYNKLASKYLIKNC